MLQHVGIYSYHCALNQSPGAVDYTRRAQFLPRAATEKEPIKHGCSLLIGAQS
jgi:hypothetical protein